MASAMATLMSTQTDSGRRQQHKENAKIIGRNRLCLGGWERIDLLLWAVENVLRIYRAAAPALEDLHNFLYSNTSKLTFLLIITY